MSALFLTTKAVLSGGIIVAVSELAKHNNAAASIVHSLWPALTAGVALTVALYFVTMHLLKITGVNL